MSVRSLPLFVLAACAGGGVVDNVPQADCAQAQVLGTPGELGRLSLPLRWRYDAALGASVSDAVAVRIPADASGVSVTVDAGDASAGLLRARIDDQGLIVGAPMRLGGARVATEATFLDTSEDTADPAWLSWLPGWGQPPLFHDPAPSGTAALPLSPDAMPREGCLEVVPVAPGRNLEAYDGELRFVVRRYEPASPIIDLNVVVPEGVQITDDEIASALARVRDIYAGGGAPEIGEVSVFEVPASLAFVGFRGSSLFRLRAVDLPGSRQTAVNLFFVTDFFDASGTLGVAAGIPGPVAQQGLAGAGVVMSVDTHRRASGDIDLGMLGDTIAHEVGHQLGLFHTSEASGDAFDPLPDTPECPVDRFGDDGEVYAEDCPDGENFMFWTAGDLPQTQMSPWQARVLRSSTATR